MFQVITSNSSLDIKKKPIVVRFVKYRDSQRENHTDKTNTSLNVIDSYDVSNHFPKFENFRTPN